MEWVHHHPNHQVPSSSKSEKDPYLTDKFAQSLDYLDTQLRLAQGRLSQYNETSTEYRKELNQQIYLTQRKQQLMHEEANNIRTQIANTKEGTKKYDDLRGSLNNLMRSWWDAEDAIQGFNKSLEASNKLIQDNIVSEYKKSYEKQKKTRCHPRRNRS